MSDRPIRLGLAAAVLLASASTAAAPMREIPRQFWGSWTDRPQLCGRPGLDDSLLVIRARAVDFYESHGVVRSVTVHSAQAITLTAAYRGEGRRWTDTDRFVLSRSGRELTVGGLAPPRRKCP